MGTTETIILAVLVILGIVVAVRLRIRSQAMDGAADLAKQVFPIWAAQGPFETGAESATALRTAYLAVFGSDYTETMADAIMRHESSYDGDPEEWEGTRRVALEAANSDTVTLAKGIAAAERLNKDFIEDGGHRMEFTKQPDGSVKIINKQIWSDEAIEEKKKQDGEAITSGVGESLVNDSSEEAQELVEFLRDVYRDNTGEEPDTNAVGRTWLVFLAEESDSELVQTFQKLNDAHGATLPDTGD